MDFNWYPLRGGALRALIQKWVAYLFSSIDKDFDLIPWELFIFFVLLDINRWILLITRFAGGALREKMGGRDFFDIFLWYNIRVTRFAGGGAIFFFEGGRLLRPYFSYLFSLFFHSFYHVAVHRFHFRYTWHHVFIHIRFLFLTYSITSTYHLRLLTWIPQLTHYIHLILTRFYLILSYL